MVNQNVEKVVNR